MNKGGRKGLPVKSYLVGMIMLMLLVAFICPPIVPHAFALQSGGAEIGDLETGSVVGQPFNQIEVALEMTALCIGGLMAWYPATAILDLRVQGTGAGAGSPVLIKLNNTLPLLVGFQMSADSAFAGPTSMNLKISLNPGETKYVGIPRSDLTYVTANHLVHYDNPLDHRMLGGQILILR